MDSSQQEGDERPPLPYMAYMNYKSVIKVTHYVD